MAVLNGSASAFGNTTAESRRFLLWDPLISAGNPEYFGGINVFGMWLVLLAAFNMYNSEPTGREDNQGSGVSGFGNGVQHVRRPIGGFPFPANLQRDPNPKQSNLRSQSPPRVMKRPSASQFKTGSPKQVRSRAPQIKSQNVRVRKRPQVQQGFPKTVSPREYKNQPNGRIREGPKHQQGFPKTVRPQEFKNQPNGRVRERPALRQGPTKTLRPTERHNPTKERVRNTPKLQQGLSKTVSPKERQNPKNERVRNVPQLQQIKQSGSAVMGLFS